jgi:hypothetical protein
MEALCARLGRTEEAHKFAALARRLWSKADSMDLEALRDDMTRRAAHIPAAATAAAGGSR